MLRRALLSLALVFSAGLASAQGQGGLVQSPILTIDSDRLFAQSAYGQRIEREIEAEAAVIAAENRSIETELREEEQALVERRAEVPPEEFRELADAFDEKVQTTRREQLTKARALEQRREEAEIRFLQAAAPILEIMMREAGAAVVMDRRDVFFSANAVDITDAAIARIDDTLGSGATGLEPAPAPQLPEPQPESPPPGPQD